MNLTYAFLADAAQASPDGKIHLLGAGVNILWRAAFPAPLNLALVAHFEYTPGEANRVRQVEIQIIDEDGQAVVPPIAGTISLQPRQPGFPKGAPLGANIVLRIDGQILPKTGTYSIEILLDGNNVGSVAFAVAPSQGQTKAA